MPAAMPATVKEIMATVLARDLVDGEWVEVGANLPVPRAGVLLAHLLWGPNMTVMIAMTKANVSVPMWAASESKARLLVSQAPINSAARNTAVNPSAHHSGRS